MHTITEEYQNKYAHDVKNEILFIGDAKSGRKGYFCMGCGKEMQAVKSKIIGRESYFRHDALAVKHSGKCTYSDETYRHKLAKEILQSTKRIRVPPVYKFDPANNGQAMLIHESAFVEAHSVAVELQFYEDDEGIINWGRNDSRKARNLIIQPDITFFNKQNKPILLIEIVATHKPSQDKLLKIMRLGINTISITIPRDSPEAIAATFVNTSRTKWIYNYDEATTEYIQSSARNTARIPHIDEEQRKLFAESHKCRKAQINNLIRRIRECLESQQYRTTKSRLESEISRVTDNTTELQAKLEDEEREYRYEAGRRDAAARRQIVVEIRNIEIEKTDLEKRYSAKAREIEEEEKLLDSRIEETIGSNGGDGKNFKLRIGAYRRERENIERLIGNEEERLNRIIVNGEHLRERFENDKRRLVEEFEQNTNKEERDIEGNRRYREKIPVQFKRDKQSAFERVRKLKEAEESAIAREQEYTRTLPEKFEENERVLRNEFEGLRQSTIEGIQTRDFKRNPYLSEGYNGIISQRGILCDILEKERIFRRYTTIREFIKSGMYKTWI